MIDIDELRFSAANSVKDLALLPSEVLELIDRLEAAESTRRDDYQNWMTALDRNAEMLAKLEAAEKERDALRTALEKIADWDSAWGPYPETNEAWRAMVIVTAREAVPRRGEKK